MRIFVIGGWPRSLVNFRGPLIRELLRQGHEVVGCAGGDDAQTTAELAVMGARYVSLPLSRTGTNPLHDLALLFSLLGLFRRERPDIVLAYTAKPVIHAMLAAKLAGVPRRCAMITGLGSAAGGTGLLAAIVGALYRTALRQADLVFFQNPDDETEFLERGWVQKQTMRVRINGSGVDLDHFAVSPAPTLPLTFLLIARLLRDKGIAEYIAAARLVKARHPACRFLLVGPPDSNPAAFGAADIARWREEGVVEYLGEAADVRPHITAAHVYVLPSYREGTPRTVLEAMAMGRPVITTDAPGCRQTVENGRNGFLVPVRDAKALADAMQRFVEQPELIPQMGANARRMAEESFDAAEVSRRIAAATLNRE